MIEQPVPYERDGVRYRWWTREVLAAFASRTHNEISFDAGVSWEASRAQAFYEADIHGRLERVK